MRFLLIFFAIVFIGKAAFPSDEIKNFADAVSHVVELRGTCHNEPKGIQAYLRVDAFLAGGTDPFSDTEWVILDRSVYVAINSMRSWPSHYEGKNLTVSGTLLEEKISEEQYRSLVEALGLVVKTDIPESALRTFRIERYTWKVNDPKVEK